MDDIFFKYYKTNYWGDDESVSGSGSNAKATEAISKALPRLFNQLKIGYMLDIPCGDFYWMQSVLDSLNVARYVGADIVPELIQDNEYRTRGGRFGFPYVRFMTLNATKDELPKVDLIFCRDMLGHFSNKDVKKALKNFRASDSKWLLSTTFPTWETKGDIKTGQWRPINLASYYGLPDPILLINEECTAGDGKFADKSLGLWDLQDW